MTNSGHQEILPKIDVEYIIQVLPNRLNDNNHNIAKDALKVWLKHVEETKNLKSDNLISFCHI